MENILTFEVCLGVHNYLIDYRDPTLKMYLSSAKYQQNTGPF